MPKGDRLSKRPTASAGQMRRRNAGDTTRQRDPIATRRAILEAAADEFDKYGFDGARVRRIADVAGVNHQLITYHFGGKRGLYEALPELWSTAMDVLRVAAEDHLSLSELTARYTWHAWQHPSQTDVLLHEQSESVPPTGERGTYDVSKVLEDLRIRQSKGELRSDLDVGMVALAFFGAAIAPRVLFWIARDLTQQDPTSKEFIDGYARQLQLVMEALSEPRSDDSNVSAPDGPDAPKP